MKDKRFSTPRDTEIMIFFQIKRSLHSLEIRLPVDALVPDVSGLLLQYAGSGEHVCGYNNKNDNCIIDG